MRKCLLFVNKYGGHFCWIFDLDLMFEKLFHNCFIIIISIYREQHSTTFQPFLWKFVLVYRKNICIILSLHLCYFFSSKMNVQIFFWIDFRLLYFHTFFTVYDCGVNRSSPKICADLFYYTPFISWYSIIYWLQEHFSS